jgi:hypothetical protein
LKIIFIEKQKKYLFNPCNPKGSFEIEGKLSTEIEILDSRDANGIFENFGGHREFLTNLEGENGTTASSLAHDGFSYD